MKKYSNTLDELKRTGSATLEDVSELAGVSSMTVSRAINKPDKVSEKTLKKVHDAINQLGYIPNMMAGALMSKQSHLIAVLVPTLAHSIFSDFVQALTDYLAEHGYHTLLGVTQYSEIKEEEILHTILGRRPDGIVLIGTNHSETTVNRLTLSSIPIVEAWDLSSHPIDMQVGFSHEEVGRATAKHLYSKGFRSFATISVSDPRGIRRTEAFIQELNESFNITPTQSIYLPHPATLATGREGYQQILNTEDQPDVIVCSSDPIAQGVLAEAAYRKISVPKQIAVQGFGDLSSAQYVYPSLSSIKLDGFFVGKKIGQLLIQRISKGMHSKGYKVDTGFTIIDRESTHII